LLSRVADNLYWMSRYFERADHCARVLEANYNLLLNPSKPSREQRWRRIVASLGMPIDSEAVDPQRTFMRLIGESSNRCSILYSITLSRENASQAREQISSEMWERLNQLYHEMTHTSIRHLTESEPIPLLSAFREGGYKFQGVSAATMNHGEGWHFIQLGKYMERACGLSVLLDAYYSLIAGADDFDWVSLLSACSAFEAYRKVYTADLTADRVAEFLILNAQFPYTVRYAADRMNSALESISDLTSRRKSIQIDRIIGKMRSSLAYGQIDEIMNRDIHSYLSGIIQQCFSLHAAVHQVYIDYPVESAFEA